MSTETGHQSRGGLKRHKKLASGSGSHGAKQAITNAFAIPAMSRRDVYERLAVDELRQRRIVSSKRRVALDWLDSLNALDRENAELLLRQHDADLRSSTQRADDDTTDTNAFMRAVHFDRPDDAWPFYAGRGRTSRKRSPG